MRHLSWFRIGAAFVVVAALIFLGKYVTSPAVLISGTPGRSDHASMDDSTFGLSKSQRNPSGGVAAAGEGAARPNQTPEESQSVDDLWKDHEEPKHVEHPKVVSDVAKPDRSKEDALTVRSSSQAPIASNPQTPVADPGLPAAEVKNHRSNPELHEDSVGDDIDDGKTKESAELPAANGNSFEGLPLNIPVNIKAKEKPSVVVQSGGGDIKGPPKEASFEQLKQYFEPDMTSRQFNSTVLIATPLRNARGHLEHYFDLLRSLNYPHRLISVALGEDSSNDGTYELAKSLAKTKLPDFHSVSIFHLDHVLHQGSDWSSVHAEGHQLERRSHMARARNELLSRALEDEDFVLWVDSDVGSWSADIVQHLLDAHVDIVAPVCMWRSAEGRVDVYDRNTWRETPESLARQQQRGDDYLMLEGYGNSPRLYLPDLRGERERLVKVDGVGGCVLLVRAVAHRRGLVFPPFVFQHHVETEGLAKMATAMGYKCYGMPFLEVFHL